MSFARSHSLTHCIFVFHLLSTFLNRVGGFFASTIITVQTSTRLASHLGLGIASPEAARATIGHYEGHPDYRIRQGERDLSRPRAVLTGGARGSRSWQWCILLTRTWIQWHQGPEELKVVDLPDLENEDAEYTIKVHAAAANFFDILQIQGKYQHQPRA